MDSALLFSLAREIAISSSAYIDKDLTNKTLHGERNPNPEIAFSLQKRKIFYAVLTSLIDENLKARFSGVVQK